MNYEERKQKQDSFNYAFGTLLLFIFCILFFILSSKSLSGSNSSDDPQRDFNEQYERCDQRRC